MTERGPLAERRDHLLDVVLDGLRLEPAAPARAIGPGRLDE
ncbi:hypothetical protein [Frankia sp. AgKG'84/4]|nr:hypothetical protein [Frankia sp. AgKG'84/4]